MEFPKVRSGGLEAFGLRWSSEILVPRLGSCLVFQKIFQSARSGEIWGGFADENDSLLAIFVTGTGSETPCRVCRVFYLSVQVRLWTLIFDQVLDSTNFTIENPAWSLDPSASKTKFRHRNFSMKIATKLVLDFRYDTHGWDPWVTSSILMCKITTFGPGFTRFRHFSFWNNYFTSVCLRCQTWNCQVL